MRALRKLVARMDIVAVATALIEPDFNEVQHWAPRMDFADACAVVLARNCERAFSQLTSEISPPAACCLPPQKARFPSENHRAMSVSDVHSLPAESISRPELVMR